MNNEVLITYLGKLEQLILSIHEKIREITGLNAMEGKILNQMKSSKNIGHASDLAKYNHVTIAAIMHCLYDLESKGLVSKSTNERDNRRKTYTLTELGVSQANLVSKSFKKGLAQYLDFLEDDKEAFARILAKTISFLEEEKHVKTV